MHHRVKILDGKGKRKRHHACQCSDSVSRHTLTEDWKHAESLERGLSNAGYATMSRGAIFSTPVARSESDLVASISTPVRLRRGPEGMFFRSKNYLYFGFGFPSTIKNQKLAMDPLPPSSPVSAFSACLLPVFCLSSALPPLLPALPSAYRSAARDLHP